MSRVDSSYIQEEWVKHLGVDVSAELKGVEVLSLYACEECHLQFFSPSVIGGESLYGRLQDLEWYYESDKWEHTFALGLIPEGSRVCEVGCGAGAFLERLRERKGVNATGLDSNVLAAAQARARGLDVVMTDLRDYGRDHEGSFDVVCGFQVLEHVADPVAFARDAARLLKVGGRLIVSVPNAGSFLKWEFNLLNMPPHHATRWDSTALRRLAAVVALDQVGVHCERLRQIHVESFVRAMAMRAGMSPLTRWLTHWRVRAFAERCLQVPRIRQCFRGHTILMYGNLGGPQAKDATQESECRSQSIE